MSVSTILPDAVTPLRASAVAAALLATVWPAGPTLAQEERPTEEDGATEDDGAVEGDSTTEDPREDPAAEVGGEIEFVDTAGLDVADAVDALVEMGVVRGCEEERFCPWEDVTRGQAASMLARALDLEPVADGPFTDIAGSTHEQQINAIHAAGIVNGCEDEEAFCATDPLTREQLATMLARAFELPPTSTTHFDDATEVHGPYVQRLGEAGIAAGCGDPLTHFCSQTPVARVHAATFLARALELMPQVELTPLEERREQQAAIDAEREAERQAELEAEREAARERRYEQAAAERLAMWERLAQCESGGNWSINTGNGYYGGLQFLLETWRSVGGSGYPHQASKEEQIYRAERLLEKPWASFSNQWPACSARLGLG